MKPNDHINDKWERGKKLFYSSIHDQKEKEESILEIYDIKKFHRDKTN